MRIRPRRNRVSASLRDLVCETRLSSKDLVLPVFIVDGENVKTPIESMPGCFRFSVDQAILFLTEASELGINGAALFPVIAENKKDSIATESKNPENLPCRAFKEIKKALPYMTLFADVAMDPYSSDGHDGIVKNGQILNDETLRVLCEMAVVQAKAGADFVAPSDMMDGRVDAIRKALDREGLENIGILSYSAKYASAFYGPFRDALDSAPKFGDKKTYQMDPGNSREALREVQLDINEGADMVMVKPAFSYLDVIRQVKGRTRVPVAAYNVSGEYAMIKAAAQNGWIDEESSMMEMLLSMKRAGADLIFTYFAVDAARVLARD